MSPRSFDTSRVHGNLRRPSRVTIVRGCELKPHHISAWSQIQLENPALDSPFFRPEFVQQVARVRDDLEVAALECNGQYIGFFAYHRLRDHIGYPPGMSLSDFHGIVIAPDATFDARLLLQACKLRAWHFDHLITGQREFRHQHWFATASPYMDLSRGFEHYRQERSHAGSYSVREALRKLRKIEREVGPLRFIPFSADPGVLHRLLALKIDQYRRTGAVNQLAESWRIDLLRSIASVRERDFSGMLSVLMAGDRIMAIHLGIMSGGVLHCWFPSYANEFARYSPGLVFWVRMAQEASSLGIRRIDLGKGCERYKQSLKTGALDLAEGSVDLRPLARHARYGWLLMRELIRDSQLRAPLQAVVRKGRGLLSCCSRVSRRV